MARLGDVRRALANRLGNIPDFTAYAFVPDSVNVPCGFFEPGRPLADFQINYGGTYTEWNLTLTILVNRVDEEAAQDAIDEYLDPTGPFIAMLQAANMGDALSELTNDISVMTATRYGAYRVGGAMYFGVQLTIKLMA